MKATWSINVPRVSKIENRRIRENWDNERNEVRTVWECAWSPYSFDSESQPCFLQMRGVKDGQHQILTDRKAWTMSALTELRGLSLITTKICSSFSKPMKFPNHDFLASLVATRQAKIQREQTHRSIETIREHKHTDLRCKNKWHLSNTFSRGVWLTQG